MKNKSLFLIFLLFFLPSQRCDHERFFEIVSKSSEGFFKLPFYHWKKIFLLSLNDVFLPTAQQIFFKKLIPKFKTKEEYESDSGELKKDERKALFFNFVLNEFINMPLLVFLYLRYKHPNDIENSLLKKYLFSRACLHGLMHYSIFQITNINKIQEILILKKNDCAGSDEAPENAFKKYVENLYRIQNNGKLKEQIRIINTSLWLLSLFLEKTILGPYFPDTFIISSNKLNFLPENFFRN